MRAHVYAQLFVFARALFRLIVCRRAAAAKDALRRRPEQFETNRRIGTVANAKTIAAVPYCWWPGRSAPQTSSFAEPPSLMTRVNPPTSGLRRGESRQTRRAVRKRDLKPPRAAQACALPSVTSKTSFLRTALGKTKISVKITKKIAFTTSNVLKILFYSVLIHPACFSNKSNWIQCITGKI